MKDTKEFLEAYRDFKEKVDLSKGGILPEVGDVAFSMLMGVPRVPADDDPSDEAVFRAIEQRTAILKAVFVEANGDKGKSFLDEGLRRYDRAAEMARGMLEEE